MDTVIAVRVDRKLYDKIVKRQKHAKRLTGVEPTISAVVRLMIGEATEERLRKAARRS